ncbi:alpha-ketoacid dehydrogenase subunit beta [Aliikangiella marina]|uniref:2-oxoisovalerate dehydrogenase subunit beta n=1 Tax=Aliikangiella marina TaxID=1712262 RepID=A0A545TE08_9GAMM|nr:alpha-ketoacid dehydrogenase subunit beta [Aliikangiella marina]TQV75463.1 alpha-ketoacid dehydrogenase subunit beta [Aliikangiella marina]
MAAITLIEAVNLAMAHEMAVDDSVVLLGEDVGANGGVFRATDGLQAKFGKERVIDTPLAESMIAGVSIGMAAQGMKPVAEIQFMGFIFPAVDQIICHAARMRHRTRGRINLPMVIRAPFGGGIHAPEHHSESTEAIFAHIPGLKVVIPSNPSRAYGLMLAAMRDPDPVIFLEPKRVYRIEKHEIEDNGEEYPLGVCFVDREGTDITLISWGAMLHETKQAAEQLAKEGISAEVIDVATVNPLDIDTILESVEKTGRACIVQEAPKAGALGSEIAAEIAEKGVMNLLAPIGRVSGYDTVMPYYRLEKQYMPKVEHIVEEAKRIVEYR